jgi:hypothetical protein
MMGPRAMQLRTPQQPFAFGVLGHVRWQVPDGVFESRLSVTPTQRPTMKAVGDCVVGFVMDSHFARVLRLDGVS